MKRIVLGLAGVVLLGLSGPAQTEELPSPGWLRDAPILTVQRPQYDAPGNSLALGELVYTQGNGHGGNGNTGQAEEREHIRDNSFFVEEAYNQEPGVAQHIFNWVGLWRYGRVHSRDSFFVYTMELPIHSQTHQFSFALPFETFFEQVDGGLPEEQGGLGNIFLNYRYQLLTEETAVVTMAPRVSLIVPSGDEGRGLGTGQTGFFFNLPVSKEMDPFAFHFNLGFAVIPDVSVDLGNGLSSPGRDLRGFNLGCSAIWLASYDLNFLVELVGFWDEELDERGFRDHTSQVILNPGLRYAVYTEEALQWVLGISVPIGLSADAPDYGVFGYMSVEHPFQKKEERAKPNAK
jgi:hypothetical protein